jgi:putative ABC transport system ATP-binding protein
MLIARDLEKRYASGGRELTVLRAVSFRVESGEFVAVLGPSGSGKTTLLGLLAGLDLPSAGAVLLDGVDLGSLSEDGRARLRREKVGFVFQSFQLLSSLTAQENVQVPLDLRGEPDAPLRARELLARVGLGDRARHYPAQLSGGEQQRVALARAFVHRPRILFADEPTGNLDPETGASIVDLLVDLNRELGTTLVLVTHDDLVASRARRTLRLAGGRLVADIAAEAKQTLMPADAAEHRMRAGNAPEHVRAANAGGSGGAGSGSGEAE